MNFHTVAAVVSLLTLCLHESGSLSGEPSILVDPLTDATSDAVDAADLQKNTRQKRFIKSLIYKGFSLVKFIAVRIVEAFLKIIKFGVKLVFRKILKVFHGVVKGLKTAVTGIYRGNKHPEEKSTTKVPLLANKEQKITKQSGKFVPLYVQIANMNGKSISKSSKSIQQLLKEMASGSKSKSILTMGKPKAGDVETDTTELRRVTGIEKATLQKLLEAPAKFSQCGTFKGMKFFALGDHCVAHLGGGLFGITPASNFQLL